MTGGALPGRGTRGLVPIVDPVAGMPEVERHVVGDVAGHLLAPPDRAVVASHQLDQVLVLEGVVDAREVVLPRRDPRRATAGLPEIAAGEQLVHLIRYEVVTEPSEARAVFLLTLGPGQDADRVPPELAVIFGDQVQQNA